MKIDPNKTWAKVEERLARERDPVLRRNLETILAHMRAEARLDVDALVDMAVLWPIDADGKIRGEDTYAGSDGLLGIETRKLSPGEIGNARFAA